ncbi:MAG TPA: ferrochelatase [Vicinamibacteria bacterium]|nr:ferrochelatase [Vicinamibacteria bacterium]
MAEYDALLLLSFGGPEGPDDVLPFLRNVVRGKNVPEERLQKVAEHYFRFGGVSPLNGENRRLLEALRTEITLPLYWGNRNWHPLLEETMERMAADGVRRALAFATSAYSSYSSCRQYLEDIERARAAVGARAPLVDKILPYFDHSGFIEAYRDRLTEALGALAPDRRAEAALLFSAHSIPLAMAEGCDYAQELESVMIRVANGLPNAKHLVYQSRSGPEAQPWLEPDILDAVRDLVRQDFREAIVVPIGFVSEHLEVVYDLDYEAKRIAAELGLELSRARTVSSHPRFVRMVREIVEASLRVPLQACDAGCCLIEYRNGR